ncbi:hypothetical protein DFJ74DRAFT_770686 [Hyaloraphidium curvatum]|nr:hypothetical protein DFJ74DRAFT_770686 [Hyaloraphidium curvatum]
MSRKPKIVIMGAGSGGLAAGLSLTRHCGTSFDIECYEARASVQQAPGGQYSLSLGNKAKWAEVFGDRGMGVEALVDAVKRPINRVMYVRGGDGSVVWSRESGPAGQYIPQVRRRDLLSIISKGLPEGFVRWNHTLASWELGKAADGREVVKLRFTNGHETEADYVVAADGNNSSFRQRYFPDSVPLVSDICSIYCIAKIPADADDKLVQDIREMVAYGQSTTSLAKDSVAGIFPLLDGELCIFLEVRDAWFRANHPGYAQIEDMPPADRLKVGIERCRTEHPAFPQFARAFEFATDNYPIWRLRDIAPIPSYNPHPRILLIGDAAHACYPYLGRGAVTALVDGAVLGNLVRTCGDDVSKAFAEFDKLRRAEGHRLWQSSREECDNWWAIGAGDNSKKLILSRMDDRRVAKEKI